MYRLKTHSNGKKYVEVGEYIIWLHSDRLEVVLAANTIEIVDFMVIEPTKAEKLYLLKELIKKYHCIEPCPFDT